MKLGVEAGEPLKASGKARLSTLSSPAILFANHAAPCRQALGGGTYNNDQSPAARQRLAF
jgi:hypothetical protein